MIEYIINPINTNTTFGNVYSFFNGVENTPLITEQHNLLKTFGKLEHDLSHLLYEVETEKRRKEMLEAWLTAYSGKKNNIFIKYDESIQLVKAEKAECLKFFIINLFIYLADDATSKPLDILQYLKNCFFAAENDGLADNILYPLNSFSNISAVAQLKVKIDATLVKIKSTTLEKSLAIQLLSYLIFLDVFEEYI